MPLLDLDLELCRPPSRERTIRLVRWVERDSRRFDELFRRVTSQEPALADRAAWVLGHFGERRPELAAQKLPAILRLLASPDTRDSVRRNCFRVLQFVPIPDARLARVVTLAFDHLSSPGAPIAVRVYAMTVAANAVARRPALAHEFREILRQTLPECAPAVQARARHVLKRLGRAER